MTKENQPVTEAVKPTPLKLVASLLILGLSAAVLLLADTRLTAWAEATELHHAFQHILIFVAGMGVGGSGLSLRRLLQKH